jgi:hypothetical protein
VGGKSFSFPPFNRNKVQQDNVTSSSLQISSLKRLRPRTFERVKRRKRCNQHVQSLILLFRFWFSNSSSYFLSLLCSRFASVNALRPIKAQRFAPKKWATENLTPRKGDHEKRNAGTKWRSYCWPAVSAGEKATPKRRPSDSTKERRSEPQPLSEASSDPPSGDRLLLPSYCPKQEVHRVTVSSSISTINSVNDSFDRVDAIVKVAMYIPLGRGHLQTCRKKEEKKPAFEFIGAVRKRKREK